MMDFFEVLHSVNAVTLLSVLTVGLFVLKHRLKKLAA
jgi:hypothetical protein